MGRTKMLTSLFVVVAMLFLISANVAIYVWWENRAEKKALEAKNAQIRAEHDRPSDQHDLAERLRNQEF